MITAEHIPTRQEIIARRARLGFPIGQSSFVPIRLVRVIDNGPEKPAVANNDDDKPAPKPDPVDTELENQVRAVIEMVMNAPPKPAMPASATGLQLKSRFLRITGIDPIDFASERRLASLAYHRHCFCWLMKKYTFYSCPRIGRLIGGRDHTTVLHGTKRIQQIIDMHALCVGTGFDEDAVTLMAFAP